VLCCDNRSWRKAVWPNYKVKRARTKAKSAHDWTALYGMMDKIKEEIKQVFPYKVLSVENCEADDLIAIICQFCDPDSKHLILSGDHDFIQLQSYPNVDQYSPVQKKWVKCPAGMSVSHYLHQEIIKGCSGDGIPNIRSADDAFIAEDGRQLPLTKTFLKTVLDSSQEDFPTEELKERYDRNSRLIDFAEIPYTIQQTILSEFEQEPKGDRRRILTYFIEKKCKHLIEYIQDF